MVGSNTVETVIVLLIPDLLGKKVIFLRYMGSLSAEHTILMVAMDFLSCPVLLAILIH